MALTSDGKNVVISENRRLTSRNAIGKYAKAYVINILMSLIGKRYIIREDGRLVYINRNSADEYVNSDYSRMINNKHQAIAKAKNKIVTSIGEIIEIASNGRYEPDNRHSSHKGDKSVGKNGFFHYDTLFAIPLYENGTIKEYTVYSADLVLDSNTDGKTYFYDLVNIKKSGYSVDLTSIRPSAEDGMATAAFNKNISNNG